MRYYQIKEDKERIRDLQAKLDSLPDQVSARLLDTIERAIEIARDKDISTIQGQTTAKSLSTALKNVDDVDLKKMYSYVAKEIIGHELNYQEIKTLLTAIQNDKVVNLKEFTSVNSTLDKIIPLINTSNAFKAFFTDLFYVSPQRVGPGEVLFTVMSKSITKGTKGDLQIGAPLNKEVEVKAGKTSGRFRDGDITKLQSPNLRTLQTKWISKYGKPIATGWSINHIVDLIKRTDEEADQVLNDFMKIFSAIFPNSSYAKDVKTALAGGNVESAKKFYSLANLEIYFKAKGEKAMGFLFINSRKYPFTTCYIDSYDDIIRGADNALNIVSSLPYPIDASGNNEEYPKISISVI
jgi:hypothetical protein